MIEAFNKMEKVLDDFGFSEFKKYDKFEKYMDGILEWNEKINITNIKDRGEFIKKHYIDSFAILGSEEFKQANNIIDIGTGGGFPGIPLAILYPEKEFMLVDSLNKRVKVIEKLVETIGLKNVKVRHGRAEDLAREDKMRSGYDLCVSRAVAGLPSLLELCIPFVKKRKYFIAYKGPGVFAEIEKASKAIKLLGCEVDRVENVMLQEDEEHKLLFIKKKEETANKYPRRAGEPIKKPL